MEDNLTHMYETVGKNDQGEAAMSGKIGNETSCPNQPPNMYMKLQKNIETGADSAGWVAGGELEHCYVKESSEQKGRMKCIIAIVLTVMLVVLVMTIVTFALALFNYSIISSGELTNENIISGQLDHLRNEFLEIEKQLTNEDNIISGQVNQLRNETQEAERALTNDISALTIQHQHPLASTRDNISQVLDNLNALKNEAASLQLQLYYGDGQWNRIAFLNMSDPSQQCPSAWRLFTSSGIRACGRPTSSGSSCIGTFYSSTSAHHRVCGRVIGYQDNTPDGFNSVDRTIDVANMDGISITYGQPRNHIWSYVAGVRESTSSSNYFLYNCPCSIAAGSGPQSFVGDNYYCESGNPLDNPGTFNFYANDKLWDGKLCEGTCCSGFKSPPWFSVYLPSPTTEIEVRICGDEGTSNENTPIELLEIYVQ